MGSISLIQLPYDSGRFGERMGRGPIALIESGLVEHLRSLGNEVDVASVRLSEGLHSEANALVELQRLTVPLLRDALSRHARPIILSGNCGPAALSAVAALNQSETATIWFDAHADFNTPETSRSGFLDGMGLAILTGRCWRRLAERFESFQPVLGSSSDPNRSKGERSTRGSVTTAERNQTNSNCCVSRIAENAKGAKHAYSICSRRLGCN